MRDVHSEPGLAFLQPHWTMTYMRGPMTRNEIRLAREWQARDQAPTAGSGEFECVRGDGLRGAIGTLQPP